MHRKDLLDEHIYDTERELELASKESSSSLSRREYFKLLTTVGAAAAISNLLPARASAQTDQAILKNAPAEYFIRNGSNLEMRWDAMYRRGYRLHMEKRSKELHGILAASALRNGPACRLARFWDARV